MITFIQFLEATENETQAKKNAFKNQLQFLHCLQNININHQQESSLLNRLLSNNDMPSSFNSHYLSLKAVDNKKTLKIKQLHTLCQLCFR